MPKKHTAIIYYKFVQKTGHYVEPIICRRKDFFSKAEARVWAEREIDLLEDEDHPAWPEYEWYFE